MSYPKQTPFSHWEKVPEGADEGVAPRTEHPLSLRNTGFSHQSKELIVSNKVTFFVTTDATICH